MIQGSIEKQYKKLERKRDPYLQRAREASKYTIPSLVPPEGTSGSTDLYRPYNGIGARGVRNLAAKLLLSLLPPNAPFFRLKVEDRLLAEMGEATKGELDEALFKIEQMARLDIETTGVRTVVDEALKHLIVAGNVLIYILPEGGMRMYPLTDFVVQRDGNGNILQVIVREKAGFSTLKRSTQKLIQEKKGTVKEDEDVDLYTSIRLMRRKDYKFWSVIQAVGDIELPDTQGRFPHKKLPWLALRFTRVDGESYGRGLIEEHQGDMEAADGLSKAVLQAAAAAARLIGLVNPNGTTNEDDLNDAENGEFVRGNAEDISFLQVNKFPDMSFASNELAKIEDRLKFVFLLNTAIQRPGERVTAEEIRFMAQELESTQGGIFSILSQELQLPLVQLILDRLEKSTQLFKLPDDGVKPLIVTGLEALGRFTDIERLRGFLSDLEPFGPEAMSRAIRFSEYAKRVGAARGVEKPEDLLTSAEEQQQQAMAELFQQIGPQLMQMVQNGQMQANQQADEQQQQGNPNG